MKRYRQRLPDIVGAVPRHTIPPTPLCLPALTLTFPSSCRSELVAFGALAAAAVMVITFAKKKSLMQPTAEEQAWLDQQLASPVHGLTAEEEKWLDKQVANAEDADMLDDARQAGERRTAIIFLHAHTNCPC